MRDYTFEGVPVAQIPTAEIHSILVDGFCIIHHDHPEAGDPVARVIERLNLELFIRARGLR